VECTVIGRSKGRSSEDACSRVVRWVEPSRAAVDR